MSEGLSAILESVARPRVLVVGDLILDRYVWGEAERVSPEGPILVLRRTNQESRPGGAGNVVSALARLGAEVSCCGVIGNDVEGAELGAMVRALASGPSDVVTEDGRPTTVKTRFVGHVQSARRAAQHMLRVDAETAAPVSAEVESHMVRFFADAIPKQDAVILSDYDKGVLTKGVIAQAVRLGRRANVPVIVDPKAGREYAVYAGATVITPNRYEAQLATGVVITDRDSMMAAAQRLLKQLDLSCVLITLDRDGMFLLADGEGTHIRTEPREVYDVTGAGDMVVSVLGMMLGARASARDAAALANVAAGIEVGKVGAASVSRDEMLQELHGRERSLPAKLKSADQLLETLAEHRRRHEAVVFTNGCFDLLHVGHIKYLQFARRQGDLLVVGLNSDDSVRRFKGPSRPILHQEDRSQVLAALEAVDYIIILDETTPEALIEQVRPDVLVKGEDWRDKGVVGREFVESHGGRVVLAPLVDGISTSDIVSRIVERYARSNDE